MNDLLLMIYGIMSKIQMTRIGENSMKLKTCLLTTLLFFSISTFAQTYTYTGPNFNEAYGSYSLSNQVTLTFELAQAVAPNSPMTDYTGQVISWSFNDGVQTLDQNNSYLPFFQFSTDASGQPNEWLMSAYEDNLDFRGQFPISAIETAFYPGNLQQEFGSQDFLCSDFNGPNGQCSSGAIQSIDSALYFSIAPGTPAGNWVGGTPQAASPVPANSLWAMLLLGAMFLTFTYYRTQKIK